MAFGAESEKREWTVAPLWRLIGAALALGLIAASLFSESAFNTLFRLDARIADLWQRLSGPDEPSGEVVVVGIDAAAIRQNGRWPWGRAALAELVDGIVAAQPKSLTLDILLTEPGPYSEVNLMRAFREKGPEVYSYLPGDPDARLAEAIRAVPTAVAVAAGSARVIDDLPRLTECASPALMAAAARPFTVQCLLFPLRIFDEVAAGYAATFVEQDLDGVVRRARAFVGLPVAGPDGAPLISFVPGMPVGALTACAGADPSCLAYDPEMPFLATPGDHGFTLPLTAADGSGPPPAPMTRSLALWLDFGALDALGPAGTGPARMVSAAAVLQRDEAEIARLRGRHVILGLARLGAIDQHTTPLASETGSAGVVIQALAADNLLAGRVLLEPDRAQEVALAYAFMIALLALARFGVSSIAGMAAIAGATVAAPIAISWAAFEFAGVILFGATPALAALLAAAPVLYGRVAALRRALAIARETRAREEARMNAAREIQLGSLPFDADFTAIGFRTAAICRPAQEVGGDFFELFRLSDGRLFAAVGDVSGKGLEASLVTALSKSIAGAVTDRTDGPLGAALAQIGREFVRQAPKSWRREKGGFVTLVAARIDPATGEAEFAAAGCEPPTVIGAGGAARRIELPSAAPLGWVERPEFETARMRLAPGDVIVMFTDGVTEAETPDGALFGPEHAELVAAAAAAEGAPGLIAAMDRAVSAHQAGRPPTDDTTILAVEWTGRMNAPD